MDCSRSFGPHFVADASNCQVQSGAAVVVGPVHMLRNVEVTSFAEASAERQRTISRRGILVFAATFGFVERAAQGAGLPESIQADLLVKVAPYDKHLRARAGDTVRTVVLHGSDATSDRWAGLVSQFLAKTERILDLPHVVTVKTYKGAANLASTCRAERVTMVLIAPEVAADVDNIRAALDGVSVLSAVPNAEYVRRGIVLGFDLVSAAPKLFVNVTQARRQDVVLSSDLLKLMTVFT
jgi:hypothetical protein